ncbi:hypothetical protein COT64_02195 [Candidatus Shapirobacteria bacterium CG09_land_8_20_14_0_10_39_12]|uniref:Uncharacterized protein n=1 Tax=Candidatus Shapirobacteria bacterium CG09_land_8_20_14_0_10_39_12 TaxID=1974885 RepID=A0A2H0WPC7_9BACT|nr:MAG: hypothetical protein COT64_02195 [Candidatus Shapirobacteria bacterium CG09_land_8_20_14_0_10_39_12]
MPYGTPIFVEGEEIICFDPAKELLKFEHPFTLNKEFRVVDFRGQLAEILRGNTDAATLSWEEIDITFANIFDQFRQQSVEFKTSIDLGPNNKLLFQTIPSRGTEDHVENFLIGSKGGVKVMDVHNHPVKVDKSTGTKKTFPYFTFADFLSLAFIHQEQVAEAVVFEEGTAIMIKTPESQPILDKAIKETGMGNFAWAELGNQLAEEWIKKCPNESTEERKQFSIEFAKKYKMRLLFIPTGQKQIETLV